MSWSDADLKRLGDLIDSGLSSRKIARTLRRPSGTVQGQAWRLGWSFGRPRTEDEKRSPGMRAEAESQRRAARADSAAKPGRRKLTILFDEDAYADIVTKASKDRLSRAQIVRELVEWGLEAVEQGDAR